MASLTPASVLCSLSCNILSTWQRSCLTNQVDSWFPFLSFKTVISGEKYRTFSLQMWFVQLVIQDKWHYWRPPNDLLLLAAQWHLGRVKRHFRTGFCLDCWLETRGGYHLPQELSHSPAFMSFKLIIDNDIFEHNELHRSEVLFFTLSRAKRRRLLARKKKTTRSVRPAGACQRYLRTHLNIL